MNVLTNLSVGKKIMGGYGLLALIIAGVVVIATVSINSNNTINERVFNLRMPTVLNTSKTVNGINYSLAALRGWMILGKDQFKSQRQDAWRQIRESEAKMKEYSKNWTNQENVARLAEISQRLNTFEAAQKEVEAISNSIDETPATKILAQEAAPRAAIIISQITRMIDLEARQAATTERKRLLGMMADVRGTMGMSLANIRAFLLTGDQKFHQKFEVMWTKNNRRFADLSRNTRLLTPEQRIAFNKLRVARAEFAPLPAKMFDIRGSSKWNMANYLLGAKAAPEAGKLLQLLNAMESNQEDLANKDVALAKSGEVQLLSTMTILGVVAVILAMFIATIISRMITVPVSQAAEGMKRIAQGDLASRYKVNSKDEMGQMVGDMNSMADSLSQIVSEVRVNSESIASGSAQISSGNANLSQRTEEQASALEETASSMEEMTSTVKQNADSAQEASKLATEAQTQAVKGGEVVQQTIIAMDEINTSSTRIADIISTIDGIAFQTNLLALNAAVEAARAGEQGRGFAVVASEVRVLAQRSAEAAKEIKGLIEDSVGKVKAGADLADESGKNLAEIVGSIEKVADIIAEIASASREQAGGIEQVNTAVTQMDDMTQQNAALVEEAAAASRSMQEQAADLNKLMGFFSVNGDGDHRASQTRRENTVVELTQAEAKKQPRSETEDRTHLDELSRNKNLKRTGTDKDWENF